MTPTPSTSSFGVHFPLAAALIGTIAFCFYARSWRDATHLLYDIPANLAVFSFIGIVILQCATTGWNWTSASRLTLLVALTVVSAGRDFLSWNISGHLTCVLAVALVLTTDSQLPILARLAYWTPVPIVLAIRWQVFDKGEHAQTYIALAVAALFAGTAIVLPQVVDCGE